MCNPFLEDETPDGEISTVDRVLLAIALVIMLIVVIAKDAYDAVVSYVKGE